MPDRDGTDLRAGDSVVYVHDAETTVAATVLSRTTAGKYVIRLDARGLPGAVGATMSGEPAEDDPGHAARRLAMRARYEELVAEARALGIDPQRPMAVDGATLEFAGRWPDDDSGGDEGDG